MSTSSNPYDTKLNRATLAIEVIDTRTGKAVDFFFVDRPGGGAATLAEARCNELWMAELLAQPETHPEEPEPVESDRPNPLQGKRLLIVIKMGPAFDEAGPEPTPPAACPLMGAWAELARLRAELDMSRQQVTTLRRRLDDALYNAQLGCPRRAALDEAWPSLNHGTHALILFDLDALNAANDRYGYAGVNWRVRMVWDALKFHLRDGDLHGQIRDGDEFGIAVPALQARGLAERVQALLQFVGLSASRAIVAAEPSLETTVKRASALIKQARAGNADSAARGVGARGVLAVDLAARQTQLAAGVARFQERVNRRAA